MEETEDTGHMDVIRWLESPDGEEWSSGTHRTVPYQKGIFADLKEDQTGPRALPGVSYHGNFAGGPHRLLGLDWGAVPAGELDSSVAGKPAPA